MNKNTENNLTEPNGEGQIQTEVSLPSWYIKPLDTKKILHGCLNCGGSEQTLDLQTVLYMVFGGWMITKDGELYFMDENRDIETEEQWNSIKKLQDIEKEAAQDPNHDWRACFDLPLRGGQYQRHDNNRWVLIVSNQGFAHKHKYRGYGIEGNEETGWLDIDSNSL